MATIEEILGKCSVEELRYAAEENKILGKGAKAELVSRLSSTVPPKKVLECVSNKELQAILGRYQLPTSGTKSELVKRVLSIAKPFKAKVVQQAKPPLTKALRAEAKETTHEKGQRFEDQVAAWARRKFKTDFAQSALARGAAVQRPHQVDIHVQKKAGLFGGADDIWIECKHMKSTVKRTHISKLVNDAKDVYEAFEKGGEKLYYNGLMFVSTSEFDIDALNYANEYDVLCVHFDGKAYKEQNSPKNWLGRPKWLEQVKYA